MKKNNLILTIVVLTTIIFSTSGYAQTVTIGKQVWTSKNLNVATYRNGDAIPQVTDPTVWGNLTTGAWCYYDNDPSNGTKYGKLYNWYAVNDPRGLAPIGYHIPTDAEWTKLIDYLGKESEAGKKMKSTSGWESYTTDCPNCKSWSAEYRKKVPCHTCKDTRESPVTHSFNGSNSSGFAALPGGVRSGQGFYSSFVKLGRFAAWWSSTESGALDAYTLQMGASISKGIYDYSKTAVVQPGSDNTVGLSVRCLKD
jgi:uncharacterized protein (TIGR02145 family)